jgi:uncharacterized membrane protein
MTIRSNTPTAKGESYLEKHLSLIMWCLAIVGLAITGVVLFIYRSTFGSDLSRSHTDWAEFGDYVGGALGPIFALLALIALLITMRLQSKELALSSKELRNSAVALADQSKSLLLQNFETRFFNMLSLHHQIVSEMDLRAKGEASQVVAKGRDCLRTFYNRLMKGLESAARGDHENYEEGVAFEYDLFYEDNGHELGHYFRNIYRILKFIDESDVADKKDYSGILRAQLSNHELALLFYNGLTRHGEKLKPLAIKYALFENLEFGLLASRAADLRLYDMEAFGDRAGELEAGSQ